MSKNKWLGYELLLTVKIHSYRAFSPIGPFWPSGPSCNIVCADTFDIWIPWSFKFPLEFTTISLIFSALNFLRFWHHYLTCSTENLTFGSFWPVAQKSLSTWFTVPVIKTEQDWIFGTAWWFNEFPTFYLINSSIDINCSIFSPFWLKDCILWYSKFFTSTWI